MVICESVITGMLQVLEHMTDMVVVNPTWVVAELNGFNLIAAKLT